MKNIIRIFKRDIKNIISNWVAIVVICGLIILPSLYAWVNIKASWDPYGNTNGIKVAIVNEDLGDVLKDKEIKIGDELVEKLNENSNLGWQFVNREDGEHGVKNGSYYATIIIPSDFTSKTLSLVNKTLQRPEIIYMVNEKSNAVAPKITDKGVSTIKDEINSNLVETVDGVIFKVFNDAGMKIEDVKPRLIRLIDAVIEIDNKMPTIENVIDQVYDGLKKTEEINNKINSNIPLLEETLKSGEEILLTTQIYLEKAKEGLKEISPTIKKDLILINEKLGSIQGMLNEVKPLDKDKAISILENISTKVTDSKDIINGVITVLEPLSENNTNLKNIIVKLNDLTIKLEDIEIQATELKTSIQNGDINVNQKLEQFKNSINTTKDTIGEIVNNYDSVYVPSIDVAVNKVNGFIENSLALLKTANEEIPAVKVLLNKANLGVEFGSKEIIALKEEMPEIKQKLSDLASKLKGISEEDQIDKLIEFIKNDYKAESEFLASPVKVKDVKLFPIPNYGSAMAPFYTILAQWVGILILVSILTVEANDFENGVKIKSYEKYFGKYLTFVSIAICQALVVTLGDLYLLKTYAVSPSLLVGVGLLSSVIFTTIIYTLVSIFGNVGKAIAVILLVLQVAASGGTFPIEVTSEFFQGINTYLPFTYAIGAMREAVAGVYKELLVKDISMLLIYFVVSIIVGLALKDPINKSTKALVDKLKSSGLLGH